MTTVSDAFEVPSSAKSPKKHTLEGGRGRARVRARVATTQRGSKLIAVATSMRGVVVEDVAHAWVWSGSPPTLNDLWATRIPDLDRVPGNSRVLHAGWVAFNYAALVWTALLSIPLWVLQHPARTALAAVVVAPLIALWIFG